MTLIHDLRQFAYSIGLDSLRVTDARPFTQEAMLLAQLQATGAYPPFAPQDIQMRCDPQRILAGARSIISVAVSYRLPPHPVSTPKADSPRGLIARYARVGDYHPLLRSKLLELASYLQSRVGHAISTRVCVDTEPLLERAVARRSGLGWFGKNNLLYVPGLGSWVVLGELITDVALPPDEPISAPSCGDCQRCTMSCPTGALTTPYRVNVRRCLSYITQMPGQVPRELRKMLGRRVWGCDVCQSVCPWNREASFGRMNWSPGADPHPHLIALLRISQRDFRRVFGSTAIAWRGKATLQRNAALALGNIGDPQSVDALAARLQSDAPPVVRGACAWALGQIGNRQARTRLLAASAVETSPEVLEEIALALH